jgi:hypothetical protein
MQVARELLLLQLKKALNSTSANHLRILSFPWLPDVLQVANTAIYILHKAASHISELM